ncbi:hypothetical protein ACWOKN_004311 [Vibrio vulnificus]|nr:hypothetical protein [Vibrio vulnificus]EHH0850171.1 hypothetical protein [Vibrio vulnificus]EHU5129774.1 hypothetical protein [Vibrio vulnificus]EHW0628699.1 hypothetical protein [Vibrio vulnificus]EII3056863.1 hypothetical protein [Vibrio vulnificus]
MFQDTVNSIQSYLYTRTISPLLGSLAVSWSLWNYKFILLLFSSLKYNDKLRMISILYSDNWEILGQGFAFPLLTSLLYLFVYPIPAKFVYKHSLEQQKKLNEIKQKTEDQVLLSVEQSIKIRTATHQLHTNFEEQLQQAETNAQEQKAVISELTSQISALKKKLADVEKHTATQNSESEIITTTIPNTSLDTEILSQMFNQNEPALKENIIMFVDAKPNIASFYFDELEKGGFIEEAYDREGYFSGYLITHKGKQREINRLQQIGEA